MPPKRAVSSGKRKADSVPDGEKSVRSEQTKKAKVDASDSTAEQTGLAPNGQPTNKVLPVKISFPPRADGATRIASWNICGLAASQKKVRDDTTDGGRVLWRWIMAHPNLWPIVTIVLIFPILYSLSIHFRFKDSD